MLPIVYIDIALVLKSVFPAKTTLFCYLKKYYLMFFNQKHPIITFLKYFYKVCSVEKLQIVILLVTTNSQQTSLLRVFTKKVFMRTRPMSVYFLYSFISSARTLIAVPP